MAPDLKKEQQATAKRPQYRYSPLSKLFFWSLNLIAGRKTTLAKVKLLEMLASIPYRSWETRQYARMTRHYQQQALVRGAGTIVSWAREAQDNEYWHLLVVAEKMEEDGLKDPWYLLFAIPLLLVTVYELFMCAMSLISIRQAFLFNAEFEDHAEHIYAQFVAEHPEWEQQLFSNRLVHEQGRLHTWADVFRRIGLDERDHMNRSFLFSEKPECIVKYSGMPARLDL